MPFLRCSWMRQRAHAVPLIAAIALSILLCLAQLASAQPAPGTSTRAPELVATEFYGWYLESLASDIDPFTDRRAQLATYVTKDLLAEIDRQSHSPDGMPEDYFLKAQDYLDDWLPYRVSSKPARSGTAKVVVVTLGATPETKRSLKLTMDRENSVWKIRKVSLAKPIAKS